MTGKGCCPARSVKTAWSYLEGMAPMKLLTCFAMLTLAAASSVDLEADILTAASSLNADSLGSLTAAETTELAEVVRDDLADISTPALRTVARADPDAMITALEAAYKHLAADADLVAAERAEVATLVASGTLSTEQLARVSADERSEIEEEKSAETTIKRDEAALEADIDAGGVGAPSVDAGRLANVELINLQVREQLLTFKCGPQFSLYIFFKHDMTEFSEHFYII